MPHRPLPCRVGLLALLLLPLPAAALQISLQPMPLREGAPAFVVLDNRDTPCRYPLPQTVVPQRRGNALEARIEGSDACSTSLPPQTVQLALGPIPDAVERVRVFRCIGNVPPGLDPCTLAVEGAVLPGSSTAVAQPVPLSPAATWASALLLLLVGATRLAVERRD